MANRQHYLTLDGLRGVAAITVMAYHRHNWIPGLTGMEYAYFAVDFFLMLSGFVIAAAYEDRLRGGMLLAQFARLRVIRLYPMIVLGALIGGAYMIADSLFWKGGEGLWEALFQIPFGLLSIPAPPVSHLITLPFQVNIPSWSLFFELVVNVLFVLILRFLNMRVLIGIIVASAIWSFTAAGVFHKMPAGYDYATLLEGFPRTTVAFFGGVLLYRLHRSGLLPKIKAGPIVLSAALVLCFMPPMLSHPIAVAYFAFAVLAFFPLLIIAGIGDEPTGWRAKACAWGGAISFPLYILHYPVYFWFSAVAAKFGWEPRATGSWPYFLTGAATCLIVAQLALWLYDEPVRRWLSANTRKTPAQVGPTVAAEA